jgi:tripartite-type tricarboxylate transporter receptor subunit TctC
MQRLLRRTLILATLIGVLPPWSPGHAQDFPTKPVELVLPYGPGGSHDLTARALVGVAQPYLGQPLVVVLKPGGGGAVGSQQVARAKPDGYTLLFGGTGPNTIFALVQKAPTGPDNFVPVARINYSPAVFAVRGDAPWRSFREVVQFAKQNPGKLSFANTGTWGAGDFPMRMVARATGIEYNNIPHDGGGPALLAVLGGHADASFQFSAQLLPHIGAGKIRALAVSDTKRIPQLPNVPTLQEEGVDVVFTQWRGVAAPKGTPAAVVEKLEAAFRHMTEDKSFQALIAQFGDEIHFLGAKEFEAAWRRESEEFAKVVAGAPK